MMSNTGDAAVWVLLTEKYIFTKCGKDEIVGDKNEMKM